MTLLRWAAASLLLLLVLLYVAAVAAMYVFQRTLLYPVPQTLRTPPVAAGFPEAEEIVAGDRKSVV